MNVFTIEDIKGIIDNLYSTIGVRMNFDFCKYPNIALGDCPSRYNFMHDLNAIADHLELPVLIKLTFTTSFVTTDLVLNQGNSMSGVAAQVCFPDLPFYKTAGMNNLPIEVRIQPDAFSYGHFFLMTQMSHEFSHIYLHSRRDPQKESEWATDLCALMMGFAPVWAQGRKRREGGTTCTQGYLSDREYEYAVTYIRGLCAPFEKLRERLSDQRRWIQADCDEISKYLKDIYLLLEFHRHKQPLKSFKCAEDSVVFMKVAQSSYRSDAEALLKECKQDTNQLIKPLQGKREFYEKDKKWMRDNLEELKVIEWKLEGRRKDLMNDFAVILQNVDDEHYRRIYNARMKAIDKNLQKASRRVLKCEKELEFLKICLGYYNKYKKATCAKGSDAKALSLICDANFIAGTRSFLKQKQERIDEIAKTKTEAYDFYCVDDEVLLSRIKELDVMISALNYCVKELKGHRNVLFRNCSFVGMIKWRWDYLVSLLA